MEQLQFLFSWFCTKIFHVLGHGIIVIPWLYIDILLKYLGAQWYNLYHGIYQNIWYCNTVLWYFFKATLSEYIQPTLQVEKLTAVLLYINYFSQSAELCMWKKNDVTFNILFLSLISCFFPFFTLCDFPILKSSWISYFHTVLSLSYFILCFVCHFLSPCWTLHIFTSLAEFEWPLDDV